MSSLNRLVRSAALRFSIKSRTKKAAAIVDFMRKNEVADVIIVGCGGAVDAGKRNARIVESAIARHAEILLAIDTMANDNVPWPFLQADGRSLPLADLATDMVLANAVIEHVGNEADQAQFVAEQTRVGRTWVITTPNKWFPVESHTSVLFKHWRPDWRASRTEFTRLLSLREFRALLPAGTTVTGHNWSATFTAFYCSNDAAASRAPGAVEQLADVRGHAGDRSQRPDATTAT